MAIEVTTDTAHAEKIEGPHQLRSESLGSLWRDDVGQNWAIGRDATGQPCPFFIGWAYIDAGQVPCWPLTKLPRDTVVKITQE
jgi:hypothetical protein